MIQLEPTKNTNCEHAPKEVVSTIFELAPLQSFSSDVLDFIKVLSKSLLKPEYRAFPDIVALGFWLRGLDLSQSFVAKSITTPNGFYKALGTVVHFTPANVDTMFVYSWVASLLMGNNNVVKLSSRRTNAFQNGQHLSAQQQLLFVLESVLNQDAFSAIRQRNVFLHFDRSSEINSLVNLHADGRVLWGGDESVLAIRKLVTKPRARDISFADRYSTAVINGSELDVDSITATAENLWRDVKPFAQQACSSPRNLVWVGNTHYLEQFMLRLSQLAATEQPDMRSSNERLVFAQWCAAKYGFEYSVLDHLCWVKCDRLELDTFDMHPGESCFMVHCVDTLNDLPNYLDAKCQTLCHSGFAKQELVNLLRNPSIKGVDRLVPMGQALSFSFDWDGFRLLESLARYVDVSL